MASLGNRRKPSAGLESDELAGGQGGDGRGKCGNVVPGGFDLDRCFWSTTRSDGEGRVLGVRPRL